MPAEQALRLSTHPDVEYVEQEQLQGATSRTARTAAKTAPRRDGTIKPSVVQDPPSWGLDRADQNELPLDNHYAYDDAGAGVTVYSISGGLDAAHPDFAGRAFGGPNFIPDGGRSDRVCDLEPSPNATEYAGLIAGTNYGVAKRANIVAVRAFDCNGFARGNSVLQAFEWVIGNAAPPAVVLFDLNDLCFLPDVTPVECTPESRVSVIAAQEASSTAVTNPETPTQLACAARKPLRTAPSRLDL